MSYSLRDAEPSGCGTVLLSVFAVDVDEWTCLLPWGLGEGGRSWGSPIWGLLQRLYLCLHMCVCVCVCVCVCPCRDVKMCVCSASNPLCRQFFFFFFSPCPQPCAANEQRLDCWLQCEMSAVCLSACDMSFWRERISSTIPPALCLFSRRCLCVFRRDSSPRQEPLRKTHWSFSFLMLCCWHAAVFGPIIPVFHCNDWLHMCIFIYVKCPSHSQGERSACPSLKRLPALC